MKLIKNEFVSVKSHLYNDESHLQNKNTYTMTLIVKNVNVNEWANE